MDTTSLLDVISKPAIIAIGTLIAAIIGGFFSYSNMITSKENKISEFRREWIDELRNQIAIFSSSFQNLMLLAQDKNTKQLDLIPSRKDAIESLAKITLMINNKDAKENKDSHEFSLNTHLDDARNMLESMSKGEKIYELKDAAALAVKLRTDSQKLLKENWKIVKSGELSYRMLKNTTGAVYFVALPLLVAISIYFFVSAMSNLNQATNGIIKSNSEAEKILQKYEHKDLP